MTPNVSIAKKGEDLVITVKNAAKADFGPSKSGKNHIIASTFGNADLSEVLGVAGARIGLNLYRPPVTQS